MRVCCKRHPHSGEAKFGIDLAAVAAVPVTLGLSGDASSANSDHHSFSGCSGFVYAYRLCEIHYGKDVYIKPYSRGDTFRANNDDEYDSESGDREKEELQRMIVHMIDPSDYTGSGVPHRTFKMPMHEGGEEEDQEEEYVLSDL